MQHGGHRERPRPFAVYTEPVPFVAEVWSPAIGRYDVTTKLSAYRERGDGAIWFIHPYDRTVRVWRKQDNGNYAETLCTRGTVPVASHPGGTINLEALFG